MFIVNTGLSYDGKRAEPGDEVDDIPTESVTWLLERGAITRKSAPARKAKKKAGE